LRRSVYEQRTRYWTLWIGFVVGLAAHVGGYVLRSSATTEPFGLLGDLLYTLGWALWTGVIVVVLVQIFPMVVMVISGCRQSRSAIMSSIGFCRSSVTGGCKLPNGTTKASFVPPQFWRRY
jgi:hypothetical protein